MSPRMSGRRVLHVSETTLGGVGGFLLDLTRHQLERGDDVTLAAPPGDMPERAREAGVDWRPWGAVPAPGPGLPGELRALRRTVRDVRPDLVHLHSSKAGLVGRLVVRGALPTVFQPHAWSFLAVEGATRRATLAWERFGARWTDVALCVSEDERRIGVEAGIRPREYRVVEHGLDLMRWPRLDEGARAAARERLGLGGGPLAVCVGRLHRQKNQGALLGVWPEVRERVPGAQLVLVGGGPDRAELEARAGEGVRLAGESDDVAGWLAAADVAVQPSRWEGFPFSVLEALACSRTVVFTDVPGLRDLAKLGFGRMVPAGDSAALRDAIAERLADGELSDADGRSAREWIERNDSVSRMRQIDRLYDELLGSGDASAA
jgi:glycosyltransferase involved in cell wall biosynthesis